MKVLDQVPSFNLYGHSSDGEEYWRHLDYIVNSAASRGIYIGMVCIWGNALKASGMDEKGAQQYGKFLADRYKKYPNIIWIIGGDIRGDVRTSVWEALASIIRTEDKEHLITFHPRGRTTSATWFNDSSWLDFNMFQSGHRRYGQRRGDKEYPIEENTEEDNWRYVEKSFMTPVKPVLDGEPVYENIPQGLGNEDGEMWNAKDVRRYAYWSVFAGSCGHTYGNNSIMQFLKPGVSPAFDAHEMWWDALSDPGFLQMKYLKKLMLSFPYFERIPDQSIVAGKNGERYDRLIATRGNDYLMVYNYSGCPMQIDLTKISGEKKSLWWYNPRNGEFTPAGESDSKVISVMRDIPYMRGYDGVFIAFDASKGYLKKPEAG